MALEALCSNELVNFIISATPFTSNNLDPSTSENATLLLDHQNGLSQHFCGHHEQQYSTASVPETTTTTTPTRREKNLSVAQGGGGGGRKKRRRRPKVCKNKEEAENQRMTHIAVERNRRKQMNEHLAVLRSLMPESYVQRGDQASIVGGAIEFVKELEHIVQSLEAQKFVQLQQGGGDGEGPTVAGKYFPTPFAQFFSYPQYTCCQLPNKYTSKSKAAIADIEVTLIETHANVRILSRRRFRQLSKLVAAFQSLYLSVLHLNVTTLDPLVLYSISAKVEEGCQLNSADDIAGAVHHMLRIIEEEAATLSCQA
ncbi:PREDICTED: transcription factor bHLH71-like [Nicotiana attenuata]|uniref:Transcription factor bhlh71 n=1 Tax=Nicotiana attenuata TaxID=49451 RepID=A0A314L3M4_NICAT|nr:PREDICTED: transcription factor bHLH71-like [Nicotiana attenuata]OIT35554.1 transcription factor bhlh71 [Nicotiana attenuata]